MAPTRRQFLGQAIGGVAVGAAAGGGHGPVSIAAAASPRTAFAAPGSGRTLLVLGGTSFLGRHIVEAAIRRGHVVTLFNRGRTNPDLFPDLEKLRGDRDGDLAPLAGRDWNAVIDTSGYYPRQVRASAGLLAEHVRQYVFVSSISVYADFARAGMDETAAVAKMPDETVEDRSFYGPLKALCERAAEEAMPGRVTVVRPGLIVGPYDNAPRFTYWPVRIERGGEVLAPGSPDDPVQYIDGRDLAEWIVVTTERGITGVFNATGPVGPTNIAELLYGCKAVTGGDVRFTWVDAGFLAEQQVRGWVDLPVWVAPEGDYLGLPRIDCSRAFERGLTTRPLADTVRDTLAWYHSFPADRPLRLTAGLTPERETELLTAWHERAAEVEPG